MWEQFKREDLNMIPKMKASGYTPIFDPVDIRGGRTTPDRPPIKRVRFHNKSRHLWLAEKPLSTVPWIAADMIDGSYKNQTVYDSLQEYLDGKKKLKKV